MSKAKVDRKNRLLPNGIPKYVRCYDNGGETADRYTVVFTGNYAGREGCDNLGMSAFPFHPYGVCYYDNHNQIIDKPTYSHLGKKIKFTDLSPDAQRCVLKYYNEYWQL